MDENGNGTPLSPHSPTEGASATLSPTWRPPKSPLPPHRLAKLANALGISTPIPAANPSSTNHTPRSFSDLGNPAEQFRRSPTPSTTVSSMGYSAYQPTTSRFLLHVIPPKYLPHDSDEESQLPMPNTPGYHTQFRRGILVPVHSTLQGQLGAIAKEYALPSSMGLILYLVSSSPHSPLSEQNDASDEPGPRLSEEIWKHLWTRVLKTEQRDDMLMPSLSSRSVTPSTPQINHLPSPGSAASRSTPFLPQENSGLLRPFLSTSGESSFPLSPQPQYSTITSPSTPSTMSDSRRSNNKSAPPSSSMSQSDEPDTPDTPDTSVEEPGGGRGVGRSDSGAMRLHLPGLNSPSLIPILAKVEFDIDRRKAAWYEPWLRSRKANHAKRTGRSASRSSKSAKRARGGKGKRNDDDVDGAEDSGDGDKEKRAPIEFLTGKKDKSDPFQLKGGYERLSESPEEMSEDEDDLDDNEDATARVSSAMRGGKDPLEDVFGSDADAWAEIHLENNTSKKNKKGKRNQNPNVVNLALTAEELAELEENGYDERGDNLERQSTREEDEVIEMLDIMRNPELAKGIPSPDKSQQQRSSLPPGSSRKVPPPLVLKPKGKSGTSVINAERSPQVLSATPSPGLAYLSGSPIENKLEEDDDLSGYTRFRSPEESEKRVGAVFDDLDLGLDPSDDFDDPNDRRRSQILMKAQLDEIERTMAQLSPRILKSDLEDEQSFSSFQSGPTLSPHLPSRNLSPGLNVRTSDLVSSSPRLPQHPEPPEESEPAAGASWPAVPFSTLKKQEFAPNPNAPPSPPRLAVNGITTSAPRSYMPSRQPNVGPSESERRKKLLEDEEASLYPPSVHSMQSNSASDSPVIPLSPDPFGRHPSTNEGLQTYQLSGADWDTLTTSRGAAIGDTETSPQVPPLQTRSRSNTTSRFSTDSISAEPPVVKSQNRATLMSMKSIKKLWRRSGPKSSSSEPVPPTPTATSSGRSSPMVPQRPERPSQEELDLPDLPNMPPPPANFGRLSPQPSVPPMPSRASVDQMRHVVKPSQDFNGMPPSGNFGRISPQPVNPPTRTSSMHSSHSSHSSRKMSIDQHNGSSLQPPPPNHLGPLQQTPYLGQLSIPSYSGRNPNPVPISTPFMQANKSGSNLDRLHFDQESPYPTSVRTRSPPVRQSPRPPSPQQLPSIPEQDKVARKSILRWKSSGSTSSSINSPVTTEPQPRSSFERPGGNSRGRRPSVINFGSTRTSVTSPDLVPPSPQIPHQYIKPNTTIVNGGLDHPQSNNKSRLTSLSTDLSYSPPNQSSLGARSASPPRSLTSSRDSQGSRPSFDASQFEFVSPNAGTLSYPYNRLDNQ